MHSYSFQVTKFKLHSYVNDSQGQIEEGLTILRYPQGLGNEGLITQKTQMSHAFAQFSRYIAETSQVRQILQGTGRGWVDDPMLPQGASE